MVALLRGGGDMCVPCCPLDWLVLTLQWSLGYPGNSDIHLDSWTSWQAQVTSGHQLWGLRGSLEQFSPGCGKQHPVPGVHSSSATTDTFSPQVSWAIDRACPFSLKTPSESLSCQGLGIAHPQLLWDADRA